MTISLQSSLGAQFEKDFLLLVHLKKFLKGVALDSHERVPLATDLTPVGQNLQGSERIEVEVLDLDDARQRLVQGEFADGKTIAVLGTYFARLNR